MSKSPTLQQLRYLVALADSGHFRRAAEAVGVTQPSLSLQIGNLEALLGVRLVERGRRAHLTPEGREVLPRARAVLDGVDGILDVCRAAGGGMPGTLRLGVSSTLGPYFLPRVLRELRAQHPEVSLVVREGAPRDLAVALDEGMHDLILAQLPVQSAEFEVARLFREPLLLVLPLDHPLAARDGLGEEDIAGLDVLSLGPGYALHDMLVEICARAGARLRLDYEGTSLDALRQMVAVDMGVTFLPALYARSEIGGAEPDVAVRPYRGGAVTRSMGVAWRRGAGKAPAMRRFAAVAREVAGRDFRGLIQREG